MLFHASREGGGGGDGGGAGKGNSVFQVKIFSIPGFYEPTVVIVPTGCRKLCHT